ncbi:hypothetical protein ACS0TY_012013 [Phlomoides rotata]
MAFITIFTTIFLGAFSTQTKVVAGNFHTYYSYLWGNNHFSIDPQGKHVELLMDRSNGAGFESKLQYGSGLFHIRMKIPERKTGGIVTTFYLNAAPDNQDPSVNHYEFDYEFLGTNGTVQTNVYDNNGGHREQSFNLWFDPSKDFHTYEILWNSHQIQFRIDNIPIRVFKNNTARGIDYPSKPMHIEGSIWNADWAGVVDWSQSPFIAQYEDFDFHACPAQGPNVAGCTSNRYFWNKPGFWELNAAEKRLMATYRKQYMSYDYCSSPSTRLPECLLKNN